MKPPLSGPAALIAVTSILLLTAAGCGDDNATGTDPSTTSSGGDAVEGLDLATCGEVEFGGDGTPDGLIVSDLPMQGDSAERSEQQVEAIRLVLEENDWSAAGMPVGFQACDDSIEKTGLWDEDTCTANAEAYAADERVLGVIGTYNSGCAAIEIPILNEEGVAMISPGNTAVCLTEPSKSCEDGQPESLYPSGTRNYARVVPNDAFQGAALAEFTSELGASHPYVLYAADDPTSTGQALNYRGAAEAAGTRLAGYESWDPEAKDFADLLDDVASSDADAVVLAGLTEQNGAALIEEKVKAVGPNDDVPLLAFDGFAQQSTIDEAGSASEGMYASVPGSVPENLSEDGVAFTADLESALGGTPVEQFAPYAGEAASVLLDAISAAGEDREAISAAVLETRDGGGLLQPYDIETSGDPSLGPISLLKAGETFEFDREVTPEEKLVEAARG